MKENQPSLPRPTTPHLLLGVVWQILAHLLLPAFMVLLWRRGRREPLYRTRIAERFGAVCAPKGAVLVYAASLGETRAAGPLIRRLLARGYHILLTHASPAGLMEGQRLFSDAMREGRMTQAYLPLDLAWCMGRMFRRCKPRLGLVVEAELWPGLMLAAARHRVPMCMVNGNYTEKGFAGDLRPAKLWRGIFWRLFTLVLTKSDGHAARYRKAGVAPGRVHNVGELKFDLPVREDLRVAGAALRAAEPRKVLTIASSVEAEEAALFEMLARMKSEMAEMPLVIWAPRSPQRFAAVAITAENKGWRVAQRGQRIADLSAPLPDFTDVDILVADALGEMDFNYAASDVTFVGATLADHGGHNIIEPLALERPVVTGPSLWGITYPAQEARAAGALIAQPDARALAHCLADLFADPKALAAFTAKTRGFHTVHKGAADRSLAALAPWL